MQPHSTGGVYGNFLSNEGEERVCAAIRNSGATFPNYRITVNLAPAEVRKEGASYDLPIAVGLLAASGQLPADPGPASFLPAGAPAPAAVSAHATSKGRPGRRAAIAHPLSTHQVYVSSEQKRH